MPANDYCLTHFGLTLTLFALLDLLSMALDTDALTAICCHVRYFCAFLFEVFSTNPALSDHSEVPVFASTVSKFVLY